MDKNNGLQEINNAKEAESIEKNNTFLEKIKKYLNDANFLSKSIVTITAIYAAFYFIQNVFYKFNCEKLYGIPAIFFSYNSDHNILVIIATVIVIAMFAYVYFFQKSNKLSKIDYICDWLYKFGTGLITGMYCVMLCLKFCGNYIEKGDLIIDIIIGALMVIAFICGTLSVFVVFSKTQKYPRISAIITTITIIIFVLGFFYEIIPINKEKKTYEFVNIEDTDYIILSKIDDKILVASYEIDEDNIYHIITYNYKFKNKYEGEYYYIDLKSPPIIEK